MDEDLKKLIESTAAETRRHFDVVAEQSESKIDTVGEGVSEDSAQLSLGPAISHRYRTVVPPFVGSRFVRSTS